MGRFKDLTGQKFGNLTAIKKLRQDKYFNWIWLCKCDCGNTKEVSSKCLLQGLTKSCGCARFKKNAYRNNPEYAIYCAMKTRCYNKNDKSYSRYGGRDIKVCEEWKNDFSQFLKDVGKRPSEDYSIERIDVNDDYKPSNCRWATNKEQSNNRRNSIKFIYKNTEYTLKQFAEQFNLPYKNLHHYYKYHNNDIQKMLNFIKNKGLLI